MKISLELFLLGFTTSFGPCLIFCGPIIFPYIASTKKGWKEGLFTIILFSLSRLIFYTFLGLVVGTVGIFAVDILHQQVKLLFILGGIFISFLGILIVFGKDPQYHLCQLISKKHLTSKYPDAILLGLVVSIFPCLPVLGVFSYVALESKNFFQGAIWGFSFGMGKLLSPLILFGALSGVIPEKLLRSPRAYNLFKLFCGLLLFLIGAQLIISKYKHNLII